jgi:uncharacterized membrane protein YhaH (DUF805 family)
VENPTEAIALEAAMTLIQLLFSFQGRINRTKFWLGFLIYFLVSVAWFSAGALFYLMWQRPDHETFWDVAPFVLIVAIIGLLVALYWLLAVGTKRLHDRAKSGTWMIAFLLPAWVLNLSSEFVDQSAIAGKYWISFVLLTAANAFLVWGLVELGLMRGMTGVNRYGDDPLAPS